MTDLGETIAVVSGLPRSGTSLMMQMLDAGGIALTQDGARAADDPNPRGYFEDERVKRLQDDNGWIPEAAGTALKVVAPLLPALPEGPSYRVIWMERDLDEVLASQRQMLGDSDPGAVPGEDAALRSAFEKVLRAAETDLERRKIPLLKIPHRLAIQQPAKVAAQVRDFLGAELNVRAAAGVVDARLHRQRKG